MSLAGLNIVLTGTLPIVRADVERAIESAGGRIQKKVNGSTNILFVGKIKGASDTVKLEDAKQLGIRIAGGAELHKMLGLKSPFPRGVVFEDVPLGFVTPKEKPAGKPKESPEAAIKREKERLEFYRQQAETGIF